MEATPAAAFTSSLWAYNGKIFCLDEEGTTYVVKAGAAFEVLHVNSQEEMALATPAIAGERLLLRYRERWFLVHVIPFSLCCAIIIAVVAVCYAQTPTPSKGTTVMPTANQAAQPNPDLKSKASNSSGIFNRCSTNRAKISRPASIACSTG